MFLKPFAYGIEAEEGQEPAMKWAHIDIAGAMEVSLVYSHLVPGWLVIADHQHDLLSGEGYEWSPSPVSYFIPLY